MALLHAHAAEREIRPAPDRAATVEIATRFGSYLFDSTYAIAMPAGLPGFPTARRFGLADLPDPRHGRFKLLQSLDGPEPAFIVMPLNLADGPIDAADIDEALDTLGIAREDAVLLLVVATRKEPNGKGSATVNLRAPIVLDLANRRARQYVLPNGRYPLRQAI
ncbi:MAG: flagellar assembly protein FliW [Rhodospirillaceae bacterium]|jgi:flagellar assembly factor FliW|nr:flagellar assembly protein FliW [Rhodospirillaceae bacterium]MBT6117974.1 flagellar assembly protein FliW [Rhodospirillaceae bacterium]